MAVDGHSNCSIARALKVNHQTIANWVKAVAQAKSQGLPMPPTSDCERIAELDERTPLWFKKAPFHLAPCAERSSRCFLSFVVTHELSSQTLQPLASRAPRMLVYCTDGLAAYRELDYWGSGHVVAEGKSRTYSVEGNNAELRHSLKQLAWRTRCFLR